MPKTYIHNRVLETRIAGVRLPSLLMCLAALITTAGSRLPVAAQVPIDPYATGGYAGVPPGYGNQWGLGGLSPFGPMIDVPPASRLWLRGEYLRWWTEGMQTPALVTTSPDGTAQNEAGILGFAGTQVLFGGDEINDGSTNGMRYRGGLFLTPAAAFGIEGEYFSLSDQNDGFSGGTGREILARPFFDPTNDRQTARLIDFPGLVDGSLSIHSETKLRSALLAGRASLCPTCGGNCIACRNSDRVDWIVGYRHLRLEDELTFSENLESLESLVAPATLSLTDQFRTKNEFNGLQLGVAYQANLKRVWLESLLRVAVGRNTQSVEISGATTITETGVTDNYAGGLLAQSTNSGSYEREQFTMVPEIGLTLGIRIFDWLHATAGYNLVYLPSVVRAGDQIDLDINPNLLAPPVDPLVGSRRPQFRYVESDYYAHGLSLGLQLQF